MNPYVLQKIEPPRFKQKWTLYFCAKIWSHVITVKLFYICLSELCRELAALYHQLRVKISGTIFVHFIVTSTCL